MSTPEPRLCLLHIRDCCERLQECANLRDKGYETSRKVAPEFRASHPDTPWREMNDLRNVLIHNYEGADADMVWAIIDREIPQVLSVVRRLLGEGAH